MLDWIPNTRLLKYKNNKNTKNINKNIKNKLSFGFLTDHLT